MRVLFALLLVPGAGAGTAVGNPTGFTIDTAAGPGVTLRAAVAEVDVIEVTDTKGNVSTVVVDGPFDLLGGTRTEISLAHAARLRVVFAGPVEIEGEGEERFELALDVAEVEVALDSPVGRVADAVLRLGAPGWLDDVSGDVSAGDAAHDALAAALGEGAALYRELDGDGRCEAEDDEEDEDEAGECETPL